MGNAYHHENLRCECAGAESAALVADFLASSISGLRIGLDPRIELGTDAEVACLTANHQSEILTRPVASFHHHTSGLHCKSLHWHLMSHATLKYYVLVPENMLISAPPIC